METNEKKIENPVKSPSNNMGAIFTEIQASVVSIDWIQATFRGFTGKFKNICVFDTNFTTKIFEKIYELRDGNKVILHISCVPRSKILPADMVIIKINNAVLYEKDPIDWLTDFAKCENLTFSNITRLDLCLDFNTFNRNYHPQTLIRHFLEEKILKNGRGHFKVVGKQSDNNCYEYLRFGKNTSAVSAYLYNKSQEMKDVYFKAHIYEHWVVNNINNNKDIWRLEFSIKDFKNCLLSTITGEPLFVTLKDLRSKPFQCQLFSALYTKYWDFRKNDYLQNKSRMKRLDLLDVIKNNYIWYDEKTKVDSNISDRIFINKIDKLNNELRDIGVDIREELEFVRDLTLQKKNLEEWYANK